MAPVAPSPHRFLPGPKRSASPSKVQPPPSSGPNKHISASDGGSKVQQRPSSSQFAPAPRFSFGKQNVQNTARVRNPARSSLATALFASNRNREDVENASSPPDSGLLNPELEKDGVSSAAIATEASDSSPGSCIALSPKRRRIEDKEENLMSSKSIPEENAIVPHNSPDVARRFITSRKSQGTIEGSNRDPNRPAFLISSVASQNSSIVPLPEEFSPHRRGQRFIPGGLATTVQQWIIEAGRTATEIRKPHPHLRGEEFAVQGKVDQVEVQGKGPCLVKARSEKGNLLNIMLPRAPNRSFDEFQVIRAGLLVVIKPPIWEIELQGTTWIVGIEWKLL
ncbi:hypothetical protein M433DRAFT_26072 [Acidomyces richmondensis BFW]|nr:MAG: hypothetical protein FE78DRAFT_34217 [Acidomyces sp. 'richmondensis']KYG43543.1 hypothetical protein M433DRAFT_26072 [Acidomyces richmondensis BFW]